ncbi:hypothetical protein VDQ50_20425, partial [Xanthomonas campestris pv. campestris]|nr:hypothetical protein [Xanthomonas campestris pv. campestris]
MIESDNIGISRQCAIVSVDTDMMGAMAANFTLRMRRVPPTFLKRFTRLVSLEPVHDLLSNSAKKAKWMNCRLVFSL